MGATGENTSEVGQNRVKVGKNMMRGVNAIVTAIVHRFDEVTQETVSDFDSTGAEAASSRDNLVNEIVGSPDTMIGTIAGCFQDVAKQVMRRAGSTAGCCLCQMGEVIEQPVRRVKPVIAQIIGGGFDIAE
jgi:hypothetical protein